MLRPGPTLRAALPEQRHEREEVRKRVEGRAVVHRIRSWGGTAVNPGGGSGGRGTGGAVRPGSRRRGNSEAGAAALRHLFQLPQAASEPRIERHVDLRGRNGGGIVVEQRRHGPTGAATAITTAAADWRQGRRQQERRDAAESCHEAGGPRRDVLVPGRLSDDGGHVAGTRG